MIIMNFSWKKILKNILYFTVYYSGLLYILISMLKGFKKQHIASILFYHRFSRKSLNGYHVHLNANEFKKQMYHIKKWYHVISMDELTTRLANGKWFPLPCVVITMDDGFLSNYTLAYPILKELELPAIIYLTTGFIGTNRAPWVDELMDILSITNNKLLCLPELLGKEVLNISSQCKKRHAFAKLFKIMLHLEHQKKVKAMHDLSEILSVNKDKMNNNGRKMLNWDEVKEMGKNNISFGAHTVTHPTLNKMELQKAKQEIIESKKEIETRIEKKIEHFAIPNGKKEDFSEELKEYCKKIGMKTVVSTEPGLVGGQSDIYFLERILPSPPIHIFACELARYMFLKS